MKNKYKVFFLLIAFSVFNFADDSTAQLRSALRKDPINLAEIERVIDRKTNINLPFNTAVANGQSIISFVMTQYCRQSTGQWGEVLRVMLFKNKRKIHGAPKLVARLLRALRLRDDFDLTRQIARALIHRDNFSNIDRISLENKLIGQGLDSSDPSHFKALQEARQLLLTLDN